VMNRGIFLRCYMKCIESLENWRILEAALREKGWRLYQWQYAWNEPTGFQATFEKSGKPDVKVVTHNHDVQEAIVKYKK